MTMFNISVTSLPPLLVGLFERDIPERLIQFVSGFRLVTALCVCVFVYCYADSVCKWLALVHVFVYLLLMLFYS